MFKVEKILPDVYTHSYDKLEKEVQEELQVEVKEENPNKYENMAEEQGSANWLDPILKNFDQGIPEAEIAMIPEDTRQEIMVLTQATKKIFGKPNGYFYGFLHKDLENIHERMKPNYTHLIRMGKAFSNIHMYVQMIASSKYDQGMLLKRLVGNINRLRLFLYGDGVSNLQIYNQGAFYHYQNIPRPDDHVFKYLGNWVSYRLFYQWFA